MENEQAVVEESDVQAVPDTEESNAQDLDALLEEYEERPGKTEEPEKPTEDTETKQLLNMMKRQMEETSRTAATNELNKTVTSIKGELDVDDQFVKAFLNMKAEDDPRLRTAYLEKESKPSAWAKIEKSIRGDLQKFIGGLADKEMTETREAVASSVLNSKTTSSESEAPDMSKMSDVEFEKHKKEVFKKAGRGAF